MYILWLRKISVWLGFILDFELKFSLAKCFISKQTFRLLYSSLYQCLYRNYRTYIAKTILWQAHKNLCDFIATIFTYFYVCSSHMSIDFVCYQHNSCVFSTHKSIELVNNTQIIVWTAHKLLCEYNNHCVNHIKCGNNTTVVCSSHCKFIGVQWTPNRVCKNVPIWTPNTVCPVHFLVC